LSSKFYYINHPSKGFTNKQKEECCLSPVKAVVVDYVGTLTTVRDYSLAASRVKLHQALAEVGFETDIAIFHEEYTKAHEKYRAVRYEKLIEVTNAVWVSEALNNLGFKTSVEDPRLKAALNVFFQDFVNSLSLRDYAETLLRKMAGSLKLGLVSNFTYAPVVHASLRKLGISRFFNAILTSDEVGWRKPHKKIFQDILKMLSVAPEEVVFIGDSPSEDIKGAQEVGMKTIFVPSQFYNLKDLHESLQQPDIVAEDLRDAYRRLSRIFTRTMT
jgi:HAD superfamily hydrolase (TIGR01549 family)